MKKIFEKSKTVVYALLSLLIVTNLLVGISLPANAETTNILDDLSELIANTGLSASPLTSANAGGTLDTGIYYIEADLNLNTDKAFANALTIAENATVYIYIPSGLTLSVFGKDGNNATAGGNAVNLRIGIGSSKTSYNSSYAYMTEPKITTSTSRGNGGTAASNGYAAILVPPTASLYIFGNGTLNATGGNGGNASAGGSGSKSGCGISRFCTYGPSNRYCWYHYVDAYHTNTDKVKYNVSSYRIYDSFYANRYRAFGAAGGGGGAVAGGGGAAIGTDGTSGTSGTAGGSPSYNYSGSYIRTLNIAKAGAPGDPTSTKTAGIINLASSLTQNIRGGNGGTSPGGSQVTGSARSYSWNHYTNSSGKTATTKFTIIDGQKGGSGGAGGNGADVGSGGTGGKGAYGGDSGVGVTGSLPGYSKSGANGSDGATGTYTGNTIAAPTIHAIDKPISKGSVKSLAENIGATAGDYLYRPLNVNITNDGGFDKDTLGAYNVELQTIDELCQTTVKNIVITVVDGPAIDAVDHVVPKGTDTSLEEIIDATAKDWRYDDVPVNITDDDDYNKDVVDTYNVKLSATDYLSKTTTKDVKIDVVDGPTINATNKTVAQGIIKPLEEIIEATAKDYKDEDVEVTITDDGDFNKDVVDTYAIELSATDDFLQTTTKTTYVTVAEGPLINAENKTVDKGSTMPLNEVIGATATDYKDESVDVSIINDGGFNVNEVRDYTVTLSATDELGQTSIKNTQVEVINVADPCDNESRVGSGATKTGDNNSITVAVFLCFFTSLAISPFFLRKN